MSKEEFPTNEILDEIESTEKSNSNILEDIKERLKTIQDQQTVIFSRLDKIESRA
ncbi:MAG: hypothetical protein QNJ31_07615 [Candidatus Caenarcaniphilales bacterium]|nr:hypothetical protein [Candidatus Caenarcaniphilales bacterium]